MNKVVIIGNLARDPELITTNSGVAMCRFTIAVQRRFTSQDGNRETDFIPVIVWRAQAENCAKFLKKGSKAAVSGSIQTRNFETTDGTKKYVTEVVADEVEFLGSKPTDNGEPQDKKEAKEIVSKFEPIDDDSLPF